MKLESQMKEQLYHHCQIDGGSYCNSFIDIIMVQVNYNLDVMHEMGKMGKKDSKAVN